MKLGLIVGGRKIVLTLPSEGDVELDLSDIVSGEGGAWIGNLDPTARDLYRYIVETYPPHEKVDLDAATCCKAITVLPVQLGKALGRLNKHGAIIVYRRKRAKSGKVEGYEIEIKKAVKVEVEDRSGPSLWIRTLDEIRTETGDSIAVELFMALCKLADIDGNVVGQSPSDIVEAMAGTVETFPAHLMTKLSDGKWIEEDGVGGVATIADFGDLIRGGMPYEGAS